MLRSFQVTNHRSLAETQELRLTRGGGPIPVPVTAIYGATASGKSSLIDALARMRDAVLHSVTGWDPYAGPARTPHLGHPDRPTEFVAGFVAEGVPYTYGFRLDTVDVTAEWLHTHPRSRKRIIFERRGTEIKIGPQFEAARFGVAALVPLVRPNALLLSLAGQMYAEALVPAYRWFSSVLEVRRGTPEPAEVAHRLGAYLSRSPDGAARLLGELRAAGLGITDVLVAEPDPMYADYLRELDADIAGTAKQVDLCATSPGHADQLEREHGVTALVLARELTTLRAARDALYTRMVARRGVGLNLVHAGIETPFDVTDESAAGLSLLGLLPDVLDALDEGKVLAVDDIGARLPAELTAGLIGLFRAAETNVRGAQLIFTGDECALGGDVRRSDAALWRVRRTENGTSELDAL
ncbi:AAA family ATPase [Nocardia bovistercoris]|uniref:AAA family ATPase n=1 Tax=Nocardia bovistercoris TaxID=2785916 RepID=A0A931N7A7_9NOCA|nr:AAA family ATPase [Nocardia bovistercoris]MBH0781401.1 AAA family ATPase [Nocardia bovistercoris]